MYQGEEREGGFFALLVVGNPARNEHTSVSQFLGKELFSKGIIVPSPKRGRKHLPPLSVGGEQIQQRFSPSHTHGFNLTDFKIDGNDSSFSHIFSPCISLLFFTSPTWAGETRWTPTRSAGWDSPWRRT